MSYGHIFSFLKDSNIDVWDRYVGHQFVQRLGDGKLPRNKFINYLKQDYIFLIHFSRAWGLAVAKTEYLDEMRFCADTISALINTEMNLHIEICAQENITREELSRTRENLANMAYTRYVLEKGLSGDFLDLIVSLAPCIFGYGEIGARLSSGTFHKNYEPWIGTYGGKDYQATCQDVGRILDTAFERRVGHPTDPAPRWDQLKSNFRVATELEIGFWDSNC